MSCPSMADNGVPREALERGLFEGTVGVLTIFLPRLGFVEAIYPALSRLPEEGGYECIEVAMCLLVE